MQIALIGAVAFDYSEPCALLREGHVVTVFNRQSPHAVSSFDSSPFSGVSNDSRLPPFMTWPR
jgi:hypothetical protein